MTEMDLELLALLSEIKSGSDFVASGKKEFILPGLMVKGFGEVAQPIQPATAQGLIAVAHKAPFGKGSETVLDNTVRSAWEIDAADISFNNPEWQKWLKTIVEEVQEQLGVQHQTITASLYKMLIYEKDDFFVWHKDSEKEKNMFATLSITLLSAHEGGELAVRFNGKEEVIDSAQAMKEYKMSYSAFYADCDHEIRPLKAGYRVCLVYNLVQTAKSYPLSAASFVAQTNILTNFLNRWEPQFGTRPKVVLLNHQYTPANFEKENLKTDDLPRVEALLKAANEADFFADLVLVTHYKMGELEHDDGYSYSKYDYDDDDDDLSDGEMGEVYEEYTKITYWNGANNIPDLGNFDLLETDIIAHNPFSEDDEPIEKEAEGYTGNAGMTMEYWYHYGAIVFWPKIAHEQILVGLPLTTRLNWLNYYTGAGAKEQFNLAYIKILLDDFAKIDPMQPRQLDQINASGIANAWCILYDEKGLAAATDSLVLLFTQISFESWEKLATRYPSHLITPIFKQVLAQETLKSTAYFVELLAFFAKNNAVTPFTESQIANLPVYLARIPSYIFTKNIAAYSSNENENIKPDFLSFSRRVI
ncbi:MAG: hypothetical protein RI894_710, partial [Bacteroidota bacterium]